MHKSFEEVKKILEENITLHSIRQGRSVFTVTSFDKIAKEICEPKPRCKFDKNGACETGVCYTIRECGARDPAGNPIYKVFKGASL